MVYFKDSSIEEKHKTLEKLYLEYGRLMYYVAYQILQDIYLAEDAVQTAFLKLERNKFKIDSISCNKTRSLMVIIVRNIAINIYNEKKKQVAVDEDDLVDTLVEKALPLDIVISNEGIAVIKKALTELDSKYSDVIMMKYFSEYTVSEIASLFNISEQLVRVRLHRARKLLMAQLQGEKQR